MLPVGFKSIVTRLDAGTLTALMRGLLQAESDLLGLAANALVVSDAVNEGDGGLDAYVADVPTNSQSMPAGSVGFQFKAYKAKTIGPKELEEELGKTGPTRVLRERGTYVLVWQADLNDLQRSNAQTKLDDAASAIVSGARTTIWDASTIVALAERHPAVVAGLQLAEFGAVRALTELEQALRIDERPFVSDDSRSHAIRQIRDRAEATTDEAIVATVSGLAGTGKTRLVVEALSSHALRDRVLYADSAEGLHPFVSRIVNDTRSSGLLVVDELDEAARESVHTRIAATRGRWRLIAIVPQTTGRFRPSGQRDVVLVPLGDDAMRQLLAQASGLGDGPARMVAEAAKGFPELAFRLADELRLDPELDLVRLAHLERPQELLGRALPDQVLRDGLKPLALFVGLGVVGEIAYQLDEVARAFGREPDALRAVIEREYSRNRFVSAAGRYRSVSPTLVAIWLAIELIDETPNLDKIIASLSEPVQDSFYRQLEVLGPDAGQLGPALVRILSASRFREVSDFDEAAGRFLRASAAVVPAQVAEIIEHLLFSISPPAVERLPRRDLVWALQILLWWPETWEPAIRSLFVLARHETEAWDNNATGVFRDAFAVYLSGSTVQYADRIGWLAKEIRRTGPDASEILGLAARQGLERHHSRVDFGFRGGGQPPDWQPATVAELHAARRGAWNALLAILDGAADSQRPGLVQSIGHGFWTMAFDGLAADAAADIRSRQWSRSERAELAADVHRLRRADAFPPPVTALLRDLHQWLVGSTDDERLAVVLATPVWELHSDRSAMLDDPPVLVELAESVSGRATAVQDALAVSPTDSDGHTRFRFLSLVARRVGSEALGTAAYAAEPPDLAALFAAVSVAASNGEEKWVDQLLRGLAAGDGAHHVTAVLPYSTVTEDRARLALDLVSQGRASPVPLENLRGGGRFLDLPLSMVRDLLTALTAAGAHESAMGMLVQAVEAWPEIASEPWVSELGARFVRDLGATGDTMLTYYFSEMVGAGVLGPPVQLALWKLRMRSTSGLPDELEKSLVAKLTGEDPHRFMEEVIGLVRDEASGAASFSLFTSRELALLSGLADELGVDIVWEQLERLTEREFRLAIHHMDWTGTVPDLLVGHFLRSRRLSGFEVEAFTAFFNTLGIVSGSYWRALAQELERAESWAEALAGTEAEQWARGLVERYQTDLAAQKIRDEEEDFRLGG